MTHPPISGLPEDLLRALAPHYTVERLLGAGGMGSVYLGRDVTLDRPVAIKVVAAELTTSRVIRERFLQEARTVARLRHASIVDVYTAGEVDGLLYFVMEYCPGESLHALLDRDKRFDDERAIVALRDLARALAYAHERGIVHRDVKPDNILFDKETGRAMLTDFGVAVALTAGEERLTGTGFVLGSPRYMSPEQASGERELDGKSDVYSLGLVAYEMFAGEPAVSGSGASVLMQQLTQTPAPVETKNDSIAPIVASAITRALAKDPAERPTAAEFAMMLDSVVSSGETRVSNPAWLPVRGRKRRRAFAVAAVVVAIAATLGVYSVFGRSDAPTGVDPRRSYFVAPFDVQGDQQLAWLREGSVSMLTLQFSQWKDIDVVDYERSLDLIREADLDGTDRVGLEEARRMARRAGVWTGVMGQVTALPDSLVVVARMYDVSSGKKVDEAQRSAPRTADPRPLYDALARDLLDLVGAPPAATMALTATTTRSVEAYRNYLEGLRALNGWRLARADSLFERATTIDSTFALAYYKHALTMGWRNAGDTSQVRMLERAARYGDRLPPRERELIGAYAALVRVLSSDVDSTQAEAAYRLAQQRYAAIVARDSGSAEAWYGLGDAHWHHQTKDMQAAVRNWTISLRAFNRAIELDSSFHLAYSHKIDIYRNASNEQSGMVLDGDSVIHAKPDSVRRAGNGAWLDAARQRARTSAMRDARAWANADASPQAYQALVAAHVAAKQYDSVETVVQEAMARPESRSPVLPFILASAQVPVDPDAALESLRKALNEADVSELAQSDGADRGMQVLYGADAATLSGSVTDLRRTGALAVAAQPYTGGSSRVPLAPVVRGWTAATELGLGLSPARVRPALDSSIRAMENLPQRFGPQMRAQMAGLPYMGYVATRDRGYLATLKRWWTPGVPTPPELDALAALEAGNRDSAQKIAAQFPSPDTILAGRGAMSAIRMSVRAEILAELGDMRGALRNLEVLDPMRIQRNAPLDPTWAFYARSFLTRGEMYEKLGERDKAIAAYEKFLELWKAADPALDAQRRIARDGIARLGGEKPADQPR